MGTYVNIAVKAAVHRDIIPPPLIKIILPLLSSPLIPKTSSLHKIIIRDEIIVCLKTSFSKNSYNIENSQLMFNANEFTGFHMIRVFAERSFRAD